MFTPISPGFHAFAAVWLFATGVRVPRRGNLIGPFKAISPDRRATILAGDGTRYRIRLVVLADGDRVTMVTFVRSPSPAWGQVLKLIMAAHRRVAPSLVERAAALGAQSAIHRSGVAAG